LSKGLRKKKSMITIENLSNYKNNIFTWFSNVALKLFLGLSISDRIDLNDVKELYGKLSLFLEEEKDRLKKYNIDVCSDIPLPVSRNDPIEKINLCEATNILKRLCSGEELDSVPLISALSIEFAEYTRAFTGRGRLKRDLYVLREDVLALSVIGAYLSRSYKVGNEYGYIFLDMTYPNVKDINRLNTNARILARRIIGEGKGPVTTLIVGIASLLASNKEILENIIQAPVTLSMIRMSKTQYKVLLNAYETIEIGDLANTLYKLGIGSSVYHILSRYPSENEVKAIKENARYKRFSDLLSISILKYYWLTDRTYLYDILRSLYIEEVSKALKVRLGDKTDNVKNNLLSMRF